MRKILACIALLFLTALLLVITFIDILIYPTGYAVHSRITEAVLDFGNHLKEKM